MCRKKYNLYKKNLTRLFYSRANVALMCNISHYVKSLCAIYYKLKYNNELDMLNGRKKWTEWNNFISVTYRHNQVDVIESNIGE